MIEQVLPTAVSAVETRSERLAGHGWPQELATSEHWVESRRQEFLTARSCAREALVALGRAPVAIPTGPAREPLWPAGVVGSITHCTGYRAAAVAHTHDLGSLGIDAEPHEPLPDDVLSQVVTPNESLELTRLRHLRRGVCWDRVLFSAKESVYKAWWPLARRWLGFEHAELRFDAVAGSFVATLLVPGPQVGGVGLTRLHGRWRVSRGLVVTAVTVPAGGAAGTL